MLIKYLEKREVKIIKILLADYIYNRYRNYRIFNKQEKTGLITREFLDAFNNGNPVIIAKDRDEILGLASLTKLIWDTKHFGMGMGRIDYLIGRGSYYNSIALKNKLLSFIFKLCEKKKIRHLSCKVDSMDFSTIHCLEDAGFKLMDTLVTYIFNLRESVQKLRKLFCIRKYKTTDLTHLITILNENIWLSRFSIDPDMPKSKTRQLYVEWLKNCCRGKLADEVLVAERGRKIVGFFTYKLDEKIKRYTGVKCLGRGIAAVSPEAKGAYVNLLNTALERGKLKLRADLGIFETQIWNYPVIKAFKRFNMDFVSTNYSFHKTLGRPRQS